MGSKCNDKCPLERHTWGEEKAIYRQAENDVATSQGMLGPPEAARGEERAHVKSVQHKKKKKVFNIFTNRTYPCN